MQTAVMAVWHHTRLTDDNPDHDLHPPGKNSWSGYQRDIANATSDYVHQNSLPEAVAEEILPTFEALSDESLLSTCLHGGTQNQNETLNGMVWQRTTKETHSSLPTVELATFLAVSVLMMELLPLCLSWTPLVSSLAVTAEKLVRNWSTTEFGTLVERVWMPRKRGENKSETGKRVIQRH